MRKLPIFAATCSLSVLAAAVQACSSDGDTPPIGQIPISDSSTSGSDSPTTLTDGGIDGTAGGDGGPDSGPPGPLTAACKKLFLPGGGNRITSFTPTATMTRFAAMNGFSTRLAWTDNTGKVYATSRSDTSSDFLDSVQITAGAITTSGGRVGMTTDGRTVVVTSGSSFSTFALQNGGGWTGPATAMVAPLNTWLTGAGGTVEEPVIGSSGDRLLFVHHKANGETEIMEAVFDVKAFAWSTPVAHSEAELVGSAAPSRKRPTGLSWDGLTLFYWDDAASMERGASRPALTDPFDDFVDLGAYPEAVPNQPCSRIYFQSSDGKGVGVFASQGTL